MTRTIDWLIWTLACAAVSGTACATPDEASVLAQLKSRYPGTQFSSVVRAQVPGLFEVRMGANLAYVSAHDLRYFVFGHVLDTTTMQDLTAARLGAAQASAAPPTVLSPTADTSLVNIVQLPIRDAITSVRGSGARHLVVFSDPGCGYCRRLQRELDQLADITIHTFIVPFQGRDLPTAIWCSPNHDTVWRDLMSDGDARPPNSLAASGATTAPSCDAPLDRNLALAQQLHVQGTPTLIFADGTRLARWASQAEIESRLTPQAQSASTQEKD